MQHDEFSIKGFAQATGISSHTLRFFDKIGLLTPQRRSNGYRVYTLDQVAMAQVIVLLQQAKFSNAEIKVMLRDAASDETLDKLRLHKKIVSREIRQLKRVQKSLEMSIERMDSYRFIRDNLGQPFCECLPERIMGCVRLNTGNIVDLFVEIHRIIGDSAWSYLSTHGLVVETQALTPHDYPLTCMYADDKVLRNHQTLTQPKGKYLSVYCDGSMESNPWVYRLVQYAKQYHAALSDTVYVQQVSGPVVEKHKQDFLVKIMVFIGH